MLERLKRHLVAVGLFSVVGGISIMNLAGQPEAGVVGTRFTGYGSLVLLGLALIIGPLSRLRPQWFGRLIAYRRAIGVWSAVGGCFHLLYAVQMATTQLSKRTWYLLFLHEEVGQDPAGHQIVRYVVNTLQPTGVVAWLGLLGLFFLVVVALFSNDLAQHWLGYPAWKWVQQFAYTGFLFIALHVLFLRYGGKLKSSPSLSPWALPWLLLAVLLQVAGFIYTVRQYRKRKDDAKPDMGNPTLSGRVHRPLHDE